MATVMAEVAERGRFIYLREAQWRALVELLPTINREAGLFDLIGRSYPVIFYRRGDSLVIASESAFAGEFVINEDGTVLYPAEW
jgi:hypothetical protein